MRYFLIYISSILITLSTNIVAGTHYKTPKELCITMGEKKENGKALETINDVSALNETTVSCIIAPKSIKDVANIVWSVNEWNKENNKIHISIAGTKHSQGGHIASEDGIVLDIKKYLNKVEDPKFNNGLWTVKVQSGALWSDVHQVIRQFKGTSLVNKVQQSSSPFTVGGSLSVNAHGRSFSYGAMINSIERFTIVLPDGTITSASRAENLPLFKDAIGGYGLFGVIVDVTLELQENNYLQSQIVSFDSLEEYIDLLTDTLDRTPRHKIQRDELGTIEKEDISPTTFLFASLALDSNNFLEKGTSYIYQKLDSVDKTGFINPDPNPSLFNLKSLIIKIGFELKRKGLFVDLIQIAQKKLEKNQNTRLKLLSPPINPILSAASHNKPDLLQEYFIPVKEMPKFINHIKEVFTKNDITLTNATLRFVPKSTDSSLLTYESATADQLSIVLYFSMELNQKNIAKAKLWTQFLVDKSIELKGRYYLPYQEWPSKEQFKKAYPAYKLFKAHKIEIDPNEVFSNKFYQHYMN